jgi:prephenate dehydrogenase
MKVGIIGSGVVGQTLAEGFLKHGHEVMLGTRHPKRTEVQAWLAGTPGANGGTFSEAARFGDIVVLAVKGLIAERAIELAGADNLAGKPLIDATNPLADEPPVEGVLKVHNRSKRVSGRAHPVTRSWGSGCEGVQQRWRGVHGEPSLRSRAANDVYLRQQLGSQTEGCGGSTPARLGGL